WVWFVVVVACVAWVWFVVVVACVAWVWFVVVVACVAWLWFVVAVACAAELGLSRDAAAAFGLRLSIEITSVAWAPFRVGVVAVGVWLRGEGAQLAAAAEGAQGQWDEQQHAGRHHDV
ncbi:hypothetical protein M1L60_07595, partial [Actinoplanes sp. TRM 88003]